MSAPLPKVSVVVNTYNRAAQVAEAIESALSQSGVDLEVVVVDDGSTDDTEAILAGIPDARMRCVRHSNRGLSASRNVGAREARGEWLLFLDDDDRLCQGALETLLSAASDPSCRVVVGGLRYVRHGEIRKERAPTTLEHALAGTFLINRSLFHEAGGYLEGLPCSHQTELFLRVRQVLRDQVGTTAFVARPVVELETRPLVGRPQQSPAHTYFGARWLLARHPGRFGSGRARAVLETLTGVSAMRIGREAEARRRFASAIRHDPLSARAYLRLAGAAIPWIGRRFWLRQWDCAPETPRLLDRVGRPHSPEGRMPSGLLEEDPSPGPESLFLPWQYQENSPQFRTGWGSSSSPGDFSTADLRDAPIYHLAARLARARGLQPVVDIGCGTGHNLVRYIGNVTNDFVGFDQPGRISIARGTFPDRTWIEGDLYDDAVWVHFSRLKPGLVICSAVVERVADPRRLLSGIRHIMCDGSMAIISTPDRNRVQPGTATGPPNTASHIREWSSEEFALLLESSGFEILRVVNRSPMGFLIQAATG